MMPHIAEELWEIMGNFTPLANTRWPTPDHALMLRDTFTIAIQIGGKLKATIELPSDATQETAEALALSEPAVMAAIKGKKLNRVIYIPKKIIYPKKHYKLKKSPVKGAPREWSVTNTYFRGWNRSFRGSEIRSLVET